MLFAPPAASMWRCDRGVHGVVGELVESYEPIGLAGELDEPNELPVGLGV